MASHRYIQLGSPGRMGLVWQRSVVVPQRTGRLAQALFRGSRGCSARSRRPRAAGSA